MLGTLSKSSVRMLFVGFISIPALLGVQVERAQSKLENARQSSGYKSMYLFSCIEKYESDKIIACVQKIQRRYKVL